MLSTFNNLPGQYVIKEDGNLRVIESVPGDVTLVIGTAPAGPTGLYLVTDTSLAETAFDPTNAKTGTLLKGMYEALESGAQYVALYRVGSSPVAVDFINGYTVVVNEASATAGTKYQLFYTNNSQEAGVTENLIIYDAATGSIVYELTDGVVDTDTGVALVYGNTTTLAATQSITIGASGNDWASSPTLAALKDFTGKTAATAATYGTAETGKTLTDATNVVTVTDGTDYHIGQLLAITSATETANDGIYRVTNIATNDVTVEELTGIANGTMEQSVSNFANGPTDGVIQPVYLTQNQTVVTGGNFAAGGTTVTALADADKFSAGMVVNITSVAQSGNNGTYLVSHVTDEGATRTMHLSKKLSYSSGTITEADFTWAGTGTDMVIQIVAKGIEAETGLSMTLNQKYQAYARAYWELEAAKVDMVIPMDVYLDEKNIVDNEGQYYAGQGTYVQPTGDWLGQGYEFENNGTLYYAFINARTASTDITADELPTPYELGLEGHQAAAWLDGKYSIATAIATTTKTAYDALGSSDEDIAWYELNFGHQLASYLDGLSTNDNEASGVISVKSPANFSKAGIFQWLGKVPTTNAAGAITVSGTGLLGNKWMAGSAGHIEGFFRTSNGLAGGTATLYRNDKVDIGRYIDVVSTGLTIRTAYDGTSTGYYTPANAVYGATIMAREANVPATNKKLKSNVSLPFSLAKKHLDALVGKKYIAFGSTIDASVKVMDAPTAALATSDYNRRSTCRISSTVLDVVRTIAEPYIGGITSQPILQALEDQVNNRLKDLQSPENQYIIRGQARVRQTQAMRIQGTAVMELTLVTAGELQRLTIYLSLSK